MPGAFGRTNEVRNNGSDHFTLGGSKIRDFILDIGPKFTKMQIFASIVYQIVRHTYAENLHTRFK